MRNGFATNKRFSDVNACLRGRFLPFDFVKSFCIDVSRLHPWPPCGLDEVLQIHPHRPPLPWRPYMPSFTVWGHGWLGHGWGTVTGILITKLEKAFISRLLDFPLPRGQSTMLPEDLRCLRGVDQSATAQLWAELSRLRLILRWKLTNFSAGNRSVAWVVNTSTRVVWTSIFNSGWSGEARLATLKTELCTHILEITHKRLVIGTQGAREPKRVWFHCWGDHRVHAVQKEDKFWINVDISKALLLAFGTTWLGCGQRNQGSGVCYLIWIIDLWYCSIQFLPTADSSRRKLCDCCKNFWVKYRISEWRIVEKEKIVTLNFTVQNIVHW